MAAFTGDYVMKVRFELATAESTNALREVARAAAMAAQAIEQLADACDKLVAQEPIEKTVSEMEAEVRPGPSTPEPAT